jgi:hypothetical protein
LAILPQKSNAAPRVPSCPEFLPISIGMVNNRLPSRRPPPPLTPSSKLLAPNPRGHSRAVQSLDPLVNPPRSSAFLCVPCGKKSSSFNL